MSSQPQTVRLPSRFPVGTRYVIEGRAGRIQLRYLEFPDGRRVELPAELAERNARGQPPRAATAGREENFEKKLIARGTPGEVLR
jgi:hypothetical protein